MKATQAAQPPDECGWESTKPQAGTDYLDRDENNGRSWALGETTQSEGGNDLAMTDNIFLDFDSEQLKDKSSSLSWNDLTDSASWPSGIDFATPQSQSLLFGDGDAGHIQLDDVQQVLSLLPPGETSSINRSRYQPSRK
jgi:hypothetical protein